MESLLLMALSNAGWAAALALVAAALGRAFRARPTRVHGLWVLVLLKLATPSAWNLPPVRVGVESPVVATSETLLARVSPPDATNNAMPFAPTTMPIVEATDPAPARPIVDPSPWPWRSMVVGLWGLGALAWGSAVIVGVIRFRRLLREAEPASVEIRERVDRLARRLGLRRGPSAWTVSARVPPMVWAIFGPPRLLLPAELWSRLDDDQRDAVLVHELAHLRRRDHWVRRLEAIVLGLDWWNPVAWWARRRVESAEEQCCDAWVAWALPGSAPAYAEALVTTAAFLSRSRSPWPLGATGVGRVPPLKARLTMILDTPSLDSSRPRSGAALLSIAVAALILLPSLAPGQAPDPVPPRAQISVKPGEPTAAPITKPEEPKPNPVEPPPTPGRRVEVARPIAREGIDEVQILGSVSENQSVRVHSQVGGTVLKVVATQGSIVERGDLLFEIDPKPYQDEVERVDREVDVLFHRVEAKRNARDLKRWEMSHGTSGTTGVELREVELSEAEAALLEIVPRRNYARSELAGTKVTSPVRGRLSETRVKVGDPVRVIATEPTVGGMRQGFSFSREDPTVLAIIDATDPIEVRFKIDERTWLRSHRRLKEGGREMSALASVRLGIEGEEGFPRRSSSLSMGNPTFTRPGEANGRATTANSDGRLVPGMLVRIQFTTKPAKSLWVTPSAVWIEGDPPWTITNNSWFHEFVKVLNDQNVVERRRVASMTIGKASLLEMNQGLHDGDRVILDAYDPEVTLGMTVTPVEVAMPENSDWTYDTRFQKKGATPPAPPNQP